MKTVTVRWGVLAALAFAWTPTELQAQSTTPCGCAPEDQRDIQSRLQQTAAAMLELDSMIKHWQGINNGATTLGEGASQYQLDSQEAFRDGVLMNNLRPVMSAAKIKQARSFGAETDAACDVTIDPNATQCMLVALRDHEDVHAKACNANKHPLPWIDWRKSQTIVDYLKEEREGYQKETDRLKLEQAIQNKHCQPTKLDPSAWQRYQKYLNLVQQTNQSNTRLQTYGSSLIDKYLGTPPTLGGGK